MNLKELQAKYEELGLEIEKLKSAEDNSWPKTDDWYWLLDDCGEVIESRWDNDSVDQNRKSFGNVFRTKVYAQKQLEAMKVIIELKRQPGRKMFLVNSGNYCISVNLYQPEVYVGCKAHYEQGWQSIYFESSQAVENAINAVGHERILSAAQWLAMGK